MEATDMFYDSLWLVDSDESSIMDTNNYLNNNNNNNNGRSGTSSNSDVSSLESTYEDTINQVGYYYPSAASLVVDTTTNAIYTGTTAATSDDWLSLVVDEVRGPIQNKNIKPSIAPYQDSIITTTIDSMPTCPPCSPQENTFNWIDKSKTIIDKQASISSPLKSSSSFSLHSDDDSQKYLGEQLNFGFKTHNTTSTASSSSSSKSAFQNALLAVAKNRLVRTNRLCKRSKLNSVGPMMSPTTTSSGTTNSTSVKKTTLVFPISMLPSHNGNNQTNQKGKKVVGTTIIGKENGTTQKRRNNRSLKRVIKKAASTTKTTTK